MENNSRLCQWGAEKCYWSQWRYYRTLLLSCLHYFTVGWASESACKCDMNISSWGFRGEIKESENLFPYKSWGNYSCRQLRMGTVLQAALNSLFEYSISFHDRHLAFQIVFAHCQKRTKTQLIVIKRINYANDSCDIRYNFEKRTENILPATIFNFH